ncbi:hypothetical protein SANTM175S_09178 [Streptomyces antimycoticus]
MLGVLDRPQQGEQGERVDQHQGRGLVADALGYRHHQIGRCREEFAPRARHREERDPLTGPQILHALADGLDDAHSLQAGNPWRGEPPLRLTRKALHYRQVAGVDRPGQHPYLRLPCCGRSRGRLLAQA